MGGEGTSQPRWVTEREVSGGSQVAQPLRPSDAVQREMRGGVPLSDRRDRCQTVLSTDSPVPGALGPGSQRALTATGVEGNRVFYFLLPWSCP